jgi:hypothetical protein
MPDSNNSEQTTQKPIYRCMTKGVRGASEEFEYGMNWLTARRSFLSIFHDRLECGDWSIPYHTITQAVLFKTRQMFIPCYILKIRTEESAYQFGLNGNKVWAAELPFPVARETGRLKYSKFSIAVRVILVVALIWYFFFRS